MKINRVSALLLLSILNLTACDAWTVKPFCERQFPVESQAAACTLGASSLASQILEQSGPVSVEAGAELCSSKCADVYSSDLGGDPAVYAELGNMLSACAQGCQASVEYQRAAASAEAASDCYRGPGGMVRCN